jgi:uncharacterized protein YndB with AHSA1/START domain
MTLARALSLILALTAFATSARAQDVGPIVHEGAVAAPVAQVWQAFSTSEGLRSWLAPHAEIDMKVGGLMRTNYNAPLDDPRTIENTVISFEPERMLSIRVSKAPANFPFPNAVRQMWTVIYFAEDDAGRTSVRIVGLGFDASPESQRMRTFFNQGNAATLSQVQRHFAGR